MPVNFDVSGLSDLADYVSNFASDSETEKANKNIVKKCAKLVQQSARGKAPKSKNPWKSGRKGSRTGKHMADNIDIATVKVKNGQVYTLVGWDKGDNSPYFYAKFIEYGWGTSREKPNPFLENALKEQKENFGDIAEKEYNKLLKNLT